MSAPVDEFAIREVLGVSTLDNQAAHLRSRVSILLREDEDVVVVPNLSSGARLTPPAARRLARQLNRLARRIEARVGS